MLNDGKYSDIFVLISNATIKIKILCIIAAPRFFASRGAATDQKSEYYLSYKIKLIMKKL